MSYTFDYIASDNQKIKITILNREEFSLLDDDGQEEYQAGPIIEEDEDDAISTLGVQGFIYNFVNEKDLYWIPKILDEFMKKNYKSTWDEGFNSYPSPTKREQFFWDFIDKEGDEALYGIDLFTIKEFYKNDTLYSLLIEECQKRDSKGI